MDESAVGTQFDFGETNNAATGIRTINFEHPIIYAHNNKAARSTGGGSPPPPALEAAHCRPCGAKRGNRTGIGRLSRMDRSHEFWYCDMT